MSGTHNWKSLLSVLRFSVIMMILQLYFITRLCVVSFVVLLYITLFYNVIKYTQSTNHWNEKIGNCGKQSEVEVSGYEKTL